MIKNLQEFITESKDISYRVFCDMDGVLTDFDNGFKALNDEGLTPDEYEAKYGKSAMWPLISKAGSKYWSELAWTKDGQSLWAYLQRYEPTILSSPSRDYSSIKGKMNWINSNLGILQTTPTTKSKNWDLDTKIILSSHKHLYVIPDPVIKSILIDDTPAKIEKWTNAGGIGVLHKSAAETITQLERITK
jgi:hypothetical protein